MYTMYENYHIYCHSLENGNKL